MATNCRPTAGEALKATEMALELYTDMIGADRVFIAGLTNITPPIGYTRGSLEVAQAGTFGYDVPLLPKRAQITCQLDWQYKDEDHVELHNRGACQNDFKQDIWIYARRNLADPTKNIIWIPNHVDSPEAGFSVMSFALPSKGVGDKFTVDLTFTNNIACMTAFIHLFDVSTPIYTFASGTPDTIVRSGGSFVTDGVLPGMKVFIDDPGVAGTNPNYRKIVTVAAGGVSATTLTLEEAGYLTTDATGSATTVLRIGYQMS